jgi:hypothetical protein
MKKKMKGKENERKRNEIGGRIRWGLRRKAGWKRKEEKRMMRKKKKNKFGHRDLNRIKK